MYWGRYPAAIISSAVWRYSRFPLSHRDSEDLLAERGVQISDDAIRLWWRTFGPAFAAGLRRHRRPAAGKWQPGSGTWTRCGIVTSTDWRDGRCIA